MALKRSRPAQPRHHGKAAPAKRRWVRPGMMAYGFELGRAAGFRGLSRHMDDAYGGQSTQPVRDHSDVAGAVVAGLSN